MKCFKKLVLLISFFIIPVGNVIAAERTATGVITSNYVFRGQTQTDKKPAIQATYHASQFKDLGWYAGLFASNVQFGAELDLYGGWRTPFGRKDEFAFDIGAVEYFYSDDRFAPTNHEFYAGISYETSYFRYFIGEENTRYFDLGTSFFVLNEFGLDLHYGRTTGLVNDGNDIGATLRKDIKGIMVAVAMTYEDLAPTKEFEFFVSITKDFKLSK